MVSLEIRMIPFFNAHLTKALGTEGEKSAALTTTPVSMTSRKSLILQQVRQDFFGQAVGFGVIAEFVHDFFNGPLGLGSEFQDAGADLKNKSK